MNNFIGVYRDVIKDINDWKGYLNRPLDFLTPRFLSYMESMNGIELI